MMDHRKTFTLGNAVDFNPPKNDVSVLLNVGTSWLWNDIQPTFTGIYQPTGNNMALFPQIIVNPPWTKKYFVKLQAIELMGGNRMSGLGLFKGQSMLLSTFQYNFNLL